MSNDIVCPDCGKEFQTRDEYAEHRKYPCVNPENPDKKGKSKYYSSWKQTNNGQYKCLVCGRYFDSYAGMGYHLSKLHDIRMTDEEQKEYQRKYAKDYAQKHKKAKTDAPETAKPDSDTDAPETAKPSPFTDMRTNKLILRYCDNCKTIFLLNIPYEVCPECRTELKKPLRLKKVHIEISEQEIL